jgi:hypothetical protein
MDLNKPCECGSKSRRYTSSTNEWVCNKCKKRTIDYSHPEAFIKVECRLWWDTLSIEKKIELYLKDKQLKETDKGEERLNV